MVCFTLSDQGIEGAASVARAVLAARRAGGRPLRVLPVPMRIDGSEHERHRLGHALARSRFAGLPEGMDARSRDEYWARIQFPYRPFYAFEEILAVFGDQPGIRRRCWRPASGSPRC
ncbi:hypothetical protein ACFQZC_16585 [Streptacidiphilus monticola]